MGSDFEKGVQKKKKLGRGWEDLSPLFLSSKDPAPAPVREEKKETSLSSPPFQIYGVSSLDRGGLRAFLASNLALALSKQGKTVWVSDEEDSPCTIRSLFGHSGPFDDFSSRPFRFFIPGPYDLTFVSGHSRILSHIIHRLKNLSGSASQRKFPDNVLITFPSPFPRALEDIIRSLDKLFLLIPFQKKGVIEIYQTIKTALTLNPRLQINAIIYQTDSPEEAVFIYQKLDGISRKFLQQGLDYGGCLPNDPLVTESMANKMPLVHHFPNSPLAQMIFALVEDPSSQPTAQPASLPAATTPASTGKSPTNRKSAIYL